MYFAVQQKRTQYCKASILQLEKKKKRPGCLSLKKKKGRKQAKKIFGLYFSWQGKLRLMKFNRALLLLLDFQHYPRASQQQSRLLLF